MLSLAPGRYASPFSQAKLLVARRHFCDLQHGIGIEFDLIEPSASVTILDTRSIRPWRITRPVCTDGVPSSHATFRLRTKRIGDLQRSSRPEFSIALIKSGRIVAKACPRCRIPNATAQAASLAVRCQLKSSRKKAIRWAGDSSSHALRAASSASFHCSKSRRSIQAAARMFYTASSSACDVG